MKHITLIRISGIAIILAILFMLVPVLPAYAANVMTVTPASGKIGDSFTVQGSTTASDQERYSYIYFSSNNLTLTPVNLITTAASRKLLGWASISVIGDANAGNFTGTFIVPAVLNDGSIAQNVTAGTYYIYATIASPTGETAVLFKASFIVTAPILDIPSPESGPAGSSVMLTGSNFPASTALVFKFDTTTITPTSGHTTTLSTGLFLSYITIPSSATVGTHTITVIAGTANVSRTFTVTPSAALEPFSPNSGPVGTDVLITGTNYPAGYAIAITHEGTSIPIKAGSEITVRSTGILMTHIIIPSNASVGSYVITVTAGTSFATATFTVTGATTTPPTATLNPPIPAFGPPGIDAAISGSDFAASSAIMVTFDIAVLTLSGTTQTGTDGSFSGTIVIPADATAGDHIITVTVGATSATTIFTVTESGTTTPPPGTTLPLIIDQTGNTVGSTISIAGSGFLPSHAVTVTFDNVTMKEVNTNASGGFVSNFLVPPNSQHGEHIISASDGSNIGTATYIVESTAPAVPQPLSPAMGEAISAPASFNWEDVDDASKPVTFNLQIATTDTFDTNTILLNITGITASEYTLTDTEQQMLASETIYYWREQAVDAALNASSWTGAGEFTMIKPFEFTGWPLYLTIGGGGLILFLLGLWVGRRTAFYY